MPLVIPQETVLSRSARLAGEGRLNLSIQKEDAAMVCEAEAAVSVVRECDRCLVPFEEDLKIAFTFVATSEQKAEAEAEEENFIYYHLNDKELDISPMVVEELLVNLPMKSLCSDSCQGLCPACGFNRNEKACQCQPVSRHPAWEALVKLKESQ